jgi:ribosomal protein L37AE/L43A
MTTDDNDFFSKISNSFYCKCCDYTTIRKYNFNLHIKSIRHKNNTNNNENNGKLAKTSKTYNCENCNKKFNDRAGIWRHKKKCEIKISSIILDKNEPSDKEVIMMLLKENTELKTMMMKVIENGTTSNSHNTNTNSHNKAFNLNFFLNETCKNAMNITDFVDSIKLQLSDLMDIGEFGYVEGISKLIVKNLNNLDQTVRPIHCTDKKRETMYVKDKDKWEKDEEKVKLNTAVKKVANKNIRMLSQFREKYTEYSNSSSLVSDTYNKTVIEATSYNDDKNKQIITNISKVTSIREKE